MIHRTPSWRVFLALGLAILATAASAEIPTLISYQGKVTDASGTPVPDNTYNMRFRIYNVATGGTSLWDSGTRSIALSGGIFNVLLGESPQPALNLAFDADYWLLVTFAGADQTPRQRLVSTGYAYMASGLVPGTEVIGAVNGGATIKAQNQGTTGWVYGGIFDAAGTSSTMAGVLGRNLHTTGTDNYGGFFLSWSPNGSGVKGQAVASTGSCNGVMGQTDSPSGRGVYGIAAATTGTCYGGQFETASTSGTGVRAYATATSGVTFGMYGRSYSSDDGSIGVYGRSSYNNNYGGTYGVYGRSDGDAGSAGDPRPVGVYGLAGNASSNFGTGGYFQSNANSGTGVEGQGATVGVRAVATAATGTNYGLSATSSSASGWAGWFAGNVNVTGSLSKGSGSFLIDHPLDPKNKLLRHNFVESPENLLIYRGTVKLGSNGEAVVTMPEYFTALAKEDEASVHLTPEGMPFLAGYRWRADGSAFTVYGDPDRIVAWMAMADRDDPVIRTLARPVEESKGSESSICDRGELLYPVAYGFPETEGRDHRIFTPSKVLAVDEPAEPNAISKQTALDRQGPGLAGDPREVSDER
ncbi:hypothetical protein JXA88_04650 [Candidatus Fermentibacteria bacterium]|nr:hypothetical protein [Candidatus Fermentibacteria bacterium]